MCHALRLLQSSEQGGSNQIVINVAILNCHINNIPQSRKNSNKISKKRRTKTIRTRSLRGNTFGLLSGPSGATRTRGFLLPKQAPYQLGYTRVCCRGQGPDSLIIREAPVDCKGESAPAQYFVSLGARKVSPSWAKRRRRGARGWSEPASRRVTPFRPVAAL